MTRPNLTNPKCPKCGAVTSKWGTIVLPKAGKQQRFHCTTCGNTFSRPK